MQKAADQVMRASGVMQRLRQFIKKDDGHRHPSDVGQTIEETAALALLGTAGGGIHVAIAVDPDTPSVFIDKMRVQQVLLNLIRNAVVVGEPGV